MSKIYTSGCKDKGIIKFEFVTDPIPLLANWFSYFEVFYWKQSTKQTSRNKNLVVFHSKTSFLILRTFYFHLILSKIQQELFQEFDN